jgi:nitroreductase
MADNYLENKFERLQQARKVVVKRNHPSLDTLLHRNRSYRGFDPSRAVKEEELRKIVSVNPLLSSGMNRQALRFKLVTRDTGADKVLSRIRMGAALPQLHLPFPGTEPEAFILVCATVPEDRILDIDLGISLQSMGLKAVEMGLNVLIICAFDKQAVREDFGLPADPLAILAVGKGAESIFLKPVEAGEDLKYYRVDGVHFVPKIKEEDLLL